MRISLLCLFALLSIPSLPAQENATAMRIELMELRGVLDALRAENDRLKEENQNLKLQLQEQQRQAAAREQMRPRPTPVPQVQAQMTGPGHQVKYVNAQHHYLIIDGGSERGLEVGEEGRILRQGEQIGKVTVSDVKKAQAVVDLDLNSLKRPGLYPKSGDRVLFP